RRSGNRFDGLTDPPGAIAVLDASLPMFRERDAALSVLAHRLMLLAWDGRVGDALADSEALLDVEAEAIRYDVLRARAYALAGAGRGEEALEVVDVANRRHATLENDLGRPGRSMVIFSEL